MKILGFGGSVTSTTKSLSDITASFKQTLEDLKQFTREKTEEKLELEDKVAELTADITKGIQIQNNLANLIGEVNEEN